MVRLLGTSPFPSPAGVAQTPAAPPVGSGQVAGFPVVSFAPEKYGGSVGAADAEGTADAPGGGAGSARARPVAVTQASVTTSASNFAYVVPISEHLLR